MLGLRCDTRALSAATAAAAAVAAAGTRGGNNCRARYSRHRGGSCGGGGGVEGISGRPSVIIYWEGGIGVLLPLPGHLLFSATPLTV